MGRLEGKVALVTGGANGLGEAMVRAMAAEGAAVALSDIDREAGERLASELTADGVRALFVEQDVADEASWDKVVSEVVSALGPLKVLVNNAGIVDATGIEDLGLSRWRQVMSINLDAVFLGVRAGVRAMKQCGGSIINISSIEGIIADPLSAAYSASKGGVRLLTKSAALYCGEQGYGVRVNSVHPGVVPTALVADAVAQFPPERAAKGAHGLVGQIPMKRLGEAREIAAGVVFLASDDSSYMTGAELVIDGGYTAH